MNFTGFEEWQYQPIGATERWVFGRKIRGIVRVPIALVYSDHASRHFWYWQVYKDDETLSGSQTFYEAIDICEKESGFLDWSK
jgi:hypothetical protein